MAVNAISSIYSGYYSYTQIDVEYDEIKKKLAALGIESSGNKAIDKLKLEEAEKTQELEKAQKTATEQATKTGQGVSETDEETQNEEFTTILNELYVNQTGNIEDDYRSAINALRERFLAETNQAELSYLRNLKDNLDKIMQGLGYSTIAIDSAEMTGASAMSALNKVMLVNAGGFSSSGK